MNAPDRPRLQTPPNPLQPDLFGASSPAPEGLDYRADLLTHEEETELVARLGELPFEPFDFHGYLANRRVVGFGFRYDYGRREVAAPPPMPAFLEPLRRKVAAFADHPAEAFAQVLINEYRPGAGIGWRRDKPQFGEVVGVSLLAPCLLRFRRKLERRWERASVPIAPRSAYRLAGPSRSVWEHSIAPLDRHRYSITFRAVAAAVRAA